MRYQGRVKTWKDDKGYGFIAPNGGGPDVFLHISAVDSGAKPNPGRMVTYELSTDDRGRPRAAGVRFAGETQERPRSGSPWVMAALLLLAGVVGYVSYRAAQPETLDGRGFACSPEKNACSRMTSCAEAKFHLQRCGVQGMDGDGDGIPCEQEWCN